MRYTMKDGTKERFGTPQSIEASVAHDAFFGPEVDAQLEQIAGGATAPAPVPANEPAPAPEPHGCLYGFGSTGYRGDVLRHIAIHWLRLALVSAREGHISIAIQQTHHAVSSSAIGCPSKKRWWALLNSVADAIATEARKQREDEDPRWSMEREWQDRRDAELERALERKAL